MPSADALPLSCRDRRHSVGVEQYRWMGEIRSSSAGKEYYIYSVVALLHSDRSSHGKAASSKVWRSGVEPLPAWGWLTTSPDLQPAGHCLPRSVNSHMAALNKRWSSCTAYPGCIFRPGSCLDPLWDHCESARSDTTSLSRAVIFNGAQFLRCQLIFHSKKRLPCIPGTGTGKILCLVLDAPSCRCC